LGWYVEIQAVISLFCACCLSQCEKRCKPQNRRCKTHSRARRRQKKTGKQQFQDWPDWPTSNVECENVRGNLWQLYECFPSKLGSQHCLAKLMAVLGHLSCSSPCVMSGEQTVAVALSGAACSRSTELTESTESTIQQNVKIC